MITIRIKKSCWRYLWKTPYYQKIPHTYSEKHQIITCTPSLVSENNNENESEQHVSILDCETGRVRRGYAQPTYTDHQMQINLPQDLSRSNLSQQDNSRSNMPHTVGIWSYEIMKKNLTSIWQYFLYLCGRWMTVIITCWVIKLKGLYNTWGSVKGFTYAECQ